MLLFISASAAPNEMSPNEKRPNPVIDVGSSGVNVRNGLLLEKKTESVGTKTEFPVNQSPTQTTSNPLFFEASLETGTLTNTRVLDHICVTSRMGHLSFCQSHGLVGIFGVCTFSYLLTVIEILHQMFQKSFTTSNLEPK